MVGLVLKVLATLAVLVFGVLFALDRTGVATPGTISVSTPSVEPCRRAVAARETKRVEYVQVRWIWTAHGYGWGCFWETEDAERHWIAPMPK